jgi:hypothetical protein
MKLAIVMLLASSAALFTMGSYANEEFYGTIGSRPGSKAGTWVIDGREVMVTGKTKLKEEHGPSCSGDVRSGGIRGEYC